MGPGAVWGDCRLRVHWTLGMHHPSWGLPSMCMVCVCVFCHIGCVNRMGWCLWVCECGFVYVLICGWLVCVWVSIYTGMIASYDTCIVRSCMFVSVYACTWWRYLHADLYGHLPLIVILVYMHINTYIHTYVFTAELEQSDYCGTCRHTPQSSMYLVPSGCASVCKPTLVRGYVWLMYTHVCMYI